MESIKYIKVLNNQINNHAYSIENGYFIFTLMPSLRCSLNCPHCYLSLEQRRNSEIMSLDNIKIAAEKVDKYYENKNIKEKVIIFYWYGGEPTEMGIEYLENATKILNDVFKKEKGYIIKHTILTSLLTIDTKIWFPFFKKYCNNHFQTSFDGLMRGETYVKKWEAKVKEAIDFGLEVGTISVVNNEILKDGAKKIYNYLMNLGVSETSFLPFMWNEQNNGDKYIKFAPTMNKWSKFMIEISEYYFELLKENKKIPEIGQLNFILTQKEKNSYANYAGQTLFLLPNGDFVLPDYKNGYQEYMRVFGNILNSDFENILKSKERMSYMRKQVLKNNNEDCNNCEHANKCVMEFWKDNKHNDDCFGGKKYVEWLLQYTEENKINRNDCIMY